MNRPAKTDSQLERIAWLVLVACVAVVPLAIAKLPGNDLPVTYTVFGFLQSLVLAAGVAVSLGFWAAALWRRETAVVVSKPLIAFGAFAAWAAVATVAAYEPLRSLLGRSTSALSLWHIATYAGLMFLVTQLVDSQARLRALAWSVLGSASVVALIALSQQLFGMDPLDLPVESWLVDRGYSTIGNPDHLGTFLVLPVILGIFLSFAEDTRNRRVLALACTAATLAAMTGTLTRGAWIAVLAGALLAAEILRRGRPSAWTRNWSLTVLGTCIAALSFALVMADPGDLVSRFTAPETAAPSAEGALGVVNAATSDRVNLWKSSLAIAAERPLTGTGPAAFELGWYPNAIDPTSAAGAGALAEDPHSLVMYLLATTGYPGAILYAVVTLWALGYGARTTLSLLTRRPLAGKALQYVAWFAAACALQVALLVAAVSTPIAMYAVLSLAVIARPGGTSHEVAKAPAARATIAVLSLIAGLLLLGAAVRPLSAELSLARTLRDSNLERARSAAGSVSWNLDVQKAYYHLRVSQVNALLSAGTPNALDSVDDLAEELAVAGEGQPREYYYPSVRAQILAEASGRSGEAAYAEAAIRAADDALDIMPANIPTRVNKALALSDLRRWAEMAEALEGYWQNELSSPYPGVLYAQALALSGDAAEAESVFAELEARFPGDGSIGDARRQTAELLEQQ